MDRSTPFDLFISYAQADEAWVKGFLFDALDQAGVRYCSAANFEPGAPLLSEFERAIRASQRTLLVLSAAYLADNVNEFINLLAAHYGLETATWPVIPLLLHPVVLPTRLSLLVPLDATDPGEWDAAIERLCATLRRPSPPRPAAPPCPYPGLAPFGEGDGERLFGRDIEIQDALGALRLHPFLAVIGPSGSGKSSLVLAGLVPKLRASAVFGAGSWLVRTMRPGEKPLETLAAALGGDPSDPAAALAAALASQPDAQRLLLVVDQFEEVFSPTCADAAAFQTRLRDVSGVPGCYVLLTVRADFYDKLLASPLWRDIQAHRLELAPLDADGVRQAITRPAENIGVYVEATLVERLVAETVGELGFLPFLQETLVLLWERLERRLLALHAYERLVLSRRAYSTLGGPALTGLQVAMAQRADQALHELSDQQQRIARQIFLRLVQFGEGRPDTRRQQTTADLGEIGDPELEATIEHLARRRLLTLSGAEQTSDRRVDIAHEALIQGWPQLEEWLRDLKQAEIVRRRLQARADEWLRLERRGGLLDEAELAEAQAWLSREASQGLGADSELRHFIRASRSAARARRRAAWARPAAAVVVVALAVAGGLLLFRANMLRQARALSPTSPIKGGPATIGTNDRGIPTSYPAIGLTLRDFRIDTHEVTNQQYCLCWEAGACPSEPTYAQANVCDAEIRDIPAVGVTLEQASAYCEWLGRRLPTEAEWEWAARGPEGRTYPTGNTAPQPQEINVSERTWRSSGPWAITQSSRDVTPDGVLGMAGNVREWTSTIYLPYDDPRYGAGYEPGQSLGDGDRVAARGGSWRSGTGYALSVARNAFQISTATDDLGFRCVEE